MGRSAVVSPATALGFGFWVWGLGEPVLLVFKFSGWHLRKSNLSHDALVHRCRILCCAVRVNVLVRYMHMCSI